MHNCYTFGTHRHYQIPASLQNTPGFAQAQMIKVFQSIYEQDYNYIDGIRTWENEKQKTAQAEPQSASNKLRATYCNLQDAICDPFYKHKFTSLKLRPQKEGAK